MRSLFRAVAAVTEPIVSEHATTARFVRLDAAELEHAGVVPARAARGTVAPMGAVVVAVGSGPVAEAGVARPALGELVDKLRVQAAACRAKAIVLNAKLVLLEADHAQLKDPSGELQTMREQLAEGSPPRPRDR